jgi:molybdopterin molybdotransferase
MISFEESLKLLADQAKPLASESVPLDEADGRVLATPVIARRNAPAVALSAMDGYAVRDSDLHSLPVSLPVAGKSFAGGPPPEPIVPGTCVRIFTGAPVPDGADRVVIQENVIAANDSAQFHLPLDGGRHIRPAGSDFAAGDVLVTAGRPLNPQRLVAVAAADTARVDVIRRPRVWIIANGDEIEPAGSASAARHHIPDSLTPALKALVRRWSGVIVGSEICPDDLALLQRAASNAVERADVVVVTGGASVGEKDYAKTMFGPDLALAFAKAAIRPGKPIWLGSVGNTIVLGLPGNPTSALVTARLYLAPLLSGQAGFDPTDAWAWRKMPLASPLGPNAERHTFLRGRTTPDGVEMLSDQNSGAQAALAEASILIQRPPHAAAAQTGEMVSVLAF